MDIKKSVIPNVTKTSMESSIPYTFIIMEAAMAKKKQFPCLLTQLSYHENNANP